MGGRGVVSRARRIRKLAELARSKERMAGIELRRLRKALQEQNEQLDQLNGFRSEYSKRFDQTGENGLDVTLMRNYHLFFRGLNDAIEAQDTTVASHHHHLEAGEAQWRHEYRKASSLDKAVDRFASEERVEMDRKQERSVEDEISARNRADRNSE